VPQPTCHWRTAESIPGKGDVRAPEQLNLTCESMALPSSPCTLYTSPPRTRTCRQQFAPPLCACSPCTPKLWKLFGGWSLHSKALEALDGASERAELVVFTSREAYVYRIPPASTTGHRADTWGVDDWLQARAHLHSCLRTAPCLLRDTAGPGGLLNCQAVLPVLLSR